MGARMTATAFNLPLESQMPAEWTPLECVVIVECLDEDGVLRLTVATTEGTSTWKSLGMVMAAEGSYRDDLKASFLSESGDDDDDQSE
jgi:hypothetical protein